MIWQISTGIMAVLLAAAGVRLHSIHMALREIRTGLEEKLAKETNTPITLACADREVRALAAGLNAQLRRLRKEQLRLQSGNDELRTAITNIAHDLRTPLTAINGYLELLEQEDLNEKQIGYIAVLRERSENLKELTEELFAYAVAASTAETLQTETVCLNKTLEQALTAYYAPLTERGIYPEIRICGETVTRKLNGKALERILGNILNNAAKYSAGDLTVELDSSGELRFSNAAPELSEVEVGKLFDRFYTVETARGSTGLGLSIARLLTEKMHGEIFAEYCEGRLVIRLRFPEG